MGSPDNRRKADDSYRTLWRGRGSLSAPCFRANDSNWSSTEAGCPTLMHEPWADRYAILGQVLIVILFGGLYAFLGAARTA